MSELSKLSDIDLFSSVGSSRPRRGDMTYLMFGGRMDGKWLEKRQKEYDDAVAEMNRRDVERGFPFKIPNAGLPASKAPEDIAK